MYPLLSEKTTITRKLEFDAGHRLINHESKCKHLHGHRYVVEVTATADHLDSVGRIIDFSVLKDVIGSWIDNWWDHNVLLHEDDVLWKTWKGWATREPFVMDKNPTAENMVDVLYEQSRLLLVEKKLPIQLTHMRLFETPNCWADFYGQEPPTNGKADE